MKRYVLAFLSVLVLLLGTVSSILPSLASAASDTLILGNNDFSANGEEINPNIITYTWKNQGNIDVTIKPSNGQTYNYTFTDNGLQPKGQLPAGTGEEYQATTCGSTPSQIFVNPFVSPAKLIEQIVMYYMPPGTTGVACQLTGSSTSGNNSTQSATLPQTPDIGSTGNADIIYKENGGQITQVEPFSDASNRSFTLNGVANVYVRTSGDDANCEDRILVTGTDTGELWELTTGGSSIDSADKSAIGLGGTTNCGYNAGQDDDVNSSIGRNKNGSFTIHIQGATLSNSTTPGSGSGGSGGTGSLANAAAALTCDTSFSNPITWIICPIIDAARGIIKSLDSVITNMLDVNGCSFFNASGAGANPLCQTTNPGQTATFTSGTASNFSQGFYLAWQTLRTIALAVVVIAGLIMVIAQAAGSEIFSSYTVKKVLPRMLIAVIAISLSWQIIQALIQVSDDLGFGVRYLIYSPFTHLGVIQLSQTGSTALAIVGAGGLATVGLFGLLIFVVAAAIAVLIAFVLITFREMVLIFFAIFAPVAIAMYILPGTEKVWKFWWSNLTKALLMFPLITAIIAIGRVFAVIVSNQPGAGVVQSLTALVAYFGPYFLIPTTFKMAGGIMGSIGNVAGRLSSSTFRTARNMESRQAKKKWEATKTGTRFKGRDYIPGSTRVAKRLSNAGQRVALANKNFGFGAKGENAMSQNSLLGAAKTRQSEAWQGIANHTDALRALSDNDTAAGAQKSLTERFKQELLNDKKAGKHNMNNEEMDKAAKQRATDAVRAVQASGHNFGNDAHKQAAAMQRVTNGTDYDNIEDLTHGLASAAGGNKSSEAALAGFANAETKRVGRLDLAPGYGNLANLVHKEGAALSGGAAAPSHKEFLAASVAASRGMDKVTTLRGKPQEMANMAATLQDNLRENYATMTSSSSTYDERSKAIEEVKRTIGEIHQYNDNRSYASEENQKIVNDMMLGNEDMMGQATLYLSSDPNGKGHIEDIARLRANPQDANNPSSVYNNQPGGPNDANQPPPGGAPPQAGS